MRHRECLILGWDIHGGMPIGTRTLSLFLQLCALVPWCVSLRLKVTPRHQGTKERLRAESRGYGKYPL